MVKRLWKLLSYALVAMSGVCFASGIAVLSGGKYNDGRT